MSVIILLGAISVSTAVLRFICNWIESEGQTKAVGSKKRTEFDCAVYLDRIFDQRLIDAGIETTLSRCNDPECFVCHPKTRAIEKPNAKGGGSPIVYPESKHCKTFSDTIYDYKRDECGPCAKNRHEYIKPVKSIYVDYEEAVKNYKNQLAILDERLTKVRQAPKIKTVKAKR